MNKLNLLASIGMLFLTGAGVAAQTATTPPAMPAPPRGVVAQTMELPMLWSSAEGNTFLGIVPEEITQENMSRYNLRSLSGVAIKEVSKDSPAEKAGLRAGDVIVRFDGETVTNLRKLQRLISETVPEQNVRVTVVRNGGEQEVSVAMAERRRAANLIRSGDFNLNNLPGLSDKGEWGIMPFPQEGGPNSFTFVRGSSRSIGIMSQELSEQLAKHFGVEDGLLIATVSKDSPADKAGLRAGDIITEIEGRKVKNVADFSRGIAAKPDGEVTLTVVRDKSKRTLKVTPEKRDLIIPRPTVAPATPTAPRVSVAPYARSLVTPRSFNRNLFRRIL